MLPTTELQRKRRSSRRPLWKPCRLYPRQKHLDTSAKLHLVSSAFRDFPAVHRLLAEPNVSVFTTRLGAQAVKTAVTDVLADARRRITRDVAAVPPYAALVDLIADRLAREEADGLLTVINGTGILLHTNLGRAPLAREALESMTPIAGGYSNVEFDLESGTRGSRYDRLTALLRATTGAQDTLVVNNCAAAVLLVLDTYARNREVIVARNQLIEIGGGFRLPDVLARSGARLIEVGTTNRVYLDDFERALSIDSALLLRSHTSNFRIAGFVADVAPRDLSELGRRAGVATVEDLGTGALVDISPYGLPRERTVREAIADGIDLVTFSGDKLLGGPQAGIIVGQRAAIARLRTNPLLRALRVDKATLAALAATLRLYTLPDGVASIPLYAMLATSLATLQARAQRLCVALGAAAHYARAVATAGYVGGGTLPDVSFESAGIAIKPPGMDAAVFSARLRRARPPVVGRVTDDAYILDLRTIPAAVDEWLGTTLTRELVAAAATAQR